MSDKLYLHVGLPKTGSSALQTFFARNRSAFAKAGVNYFSDERAASAAHGAISSGNGGKLIRWLHPERRGFRFSWRGVRDEFFASYFGDKTQALISTELLFAASDRELAKFAEMLGSATVVSVVAVVRDIYGHCLSNYGQRVKRRGLTADFPEFARLMYGNPQYRALNRISGVFGEENVTVLHYESIMGDIGSAFLTQGLRLPQTGEFRTDLPKVNRSLTLPEIEVLRELNELHNGRLSVLLSDALIYNRPEIDTTSRMDVAIYNGLVRRFRHEVEDLNRRFFDGKQVLGFGMRQNAQGAENLEADKLEAYRVVAHTLLRHYEQGEKGRWHVYKYAKPERILAALQACNRRLRRM